MPTGPAPRGNGTLADFLQRAIFPFSQGAPVLNAIAAKARALAQVQSAGFRAMAAQIVADAAELARQLADRGYDIVTGGTENHIVLLDLTDRGLSGLVAERALEECNITVNKNRVPHDPRQAMTTSGLRLGANGLARRGMEPSDMIACAELIDRVLTAVQPVDDRSYRLPAEVRDLARADVAMLCRAFPIPGYPAFSSAAGQPGEPVLSRPAG